VCLLQPLLKCHLHPYTHLQHPTHLVLAAVALPHAVHQIPLHRAHQVVAIQAFHAHHLPLVVHQIQKVQAVLFLLPLHILLVLLHQCALPVH